MMRKRLIQVERAARMMVMMVMMMRDRWSGDLADWRLVKLWVSEVCLSK